MKKYNSYKDSGIDCIGLIPKSWNIKKTFHYFKAEKGKKAAILTKEYCGTIEGNYPVYSGQTENNGVMGSINEFEFDFSDDGCILSTTVGAKAMSINFISGKFSLSQNCMVITSRNKLEILNKYFFYLFQPIFNFHRNLIPDHMQPSFRMDDLYQFKIIIPSIEEQTIITNFLDQKTTQIDDLISKKERLIQLLEEERTAIINQAVTNGLDPNAKMKDSGIEWMGEIPAHWEVKRLRNMVDSVKTGSTPPTDEIQFFSPQEINWYGPGDFENLFLGEAKRKISRLAIDQNKCRLFPSNSLLLIGIGATVGKVGLSTEPCSSNQQINAITLKKVYNPEYYLYYLSTIKEIIAAEASSSTLPIFNQTQTKNIIVSVPPIDEQNHIVRFIKNQTERIQAINSKTQQEIELLKEYKTTLISEVVTGKVDVRNWQPMNKN